MRHAILAICFVVSLPISQAGAKGGLAPDAPAPVPAAADAALPTDPDAPSLVDSIRIIIEDKVKTGGEIRFTFMPESGEKKVIRVPVTASMPKEDIATNVANEFIAALGDGYKVDRYESDKISITAKMKGGNFLLTLGAMTATGLNVRLQ